jgi:hypothetical protein
MDRKVEGLAEPEPLISPDPVRLGHANARDSPASASGSQCFISMVRKIAMARQTVHRAKSEAGCAPAPPFQDSMLAPLMPA